MLIHKKRIKNPKRYLYEIPEGKNFYLAVKVQQDKFEKANYYGLKEDSALRIPIGRGSATHFNADGKWIVKRDLPLEKRVFEHNYHVVDWHGNDHYGTCYQSRMCYQREYIKPAEIAFSYESGIVLSQQLSNFETCYDNIKLAINVMLEIFGECEIWDENKAPIIPQMKEKFVPWEILRSGTRDNAVWEKHIDAILKNKSKSQQNVIRNRHNFINTLKPDYRVLGVQNFYGYVVYAFEKKNLYIFESDSIDNATYAFVGDWQEASKLTKTQILCGNLQYARVFHTKSWHDNVTRVVQYSRKDIA